MLRSGISGSWRLLPHVDLPRDRRRDERGAEIADSFRLGSRSSPRSSRRPLSPEWHIVAGGIEDRLRKTPDRRYHANQIVLGHRQSVLGEESSPTIRVERLARECIGQAFQGLGGDARGPACEGAVDRFDQRGSVEGQRPGQRNQIVVVLGAAVGLPSTTMASSFSATVVYGVYARTLAMGIPSSPPGTRSTVLGNTASPRPTST